MFLMFGILRHVERLELFLLDQRLDDVLGGLDQVVLARARTSFASISSFERVGLVVHLDAGLLGEAVEHRLRDVLRPAEQIAMLLWAASEFLRQRDSTAQRQRGERFAFASCSVSSVLSVW